MPKIAASIRMKNEIRARNPATIIQTLAVIPSLIFSLNSASANRISFLKRSGSASSTSVMLRTSAELRMPSKGIGPAPRRDRAAGCTGAAAIPCPSLEKAGQGKTANGGGAQNQGRILPNIGRCGLQQRLRRLPAYRLRQIGDTGGHAANEAGQLRRVRLEGIRCGRRRAADMPEEVGPGLDLITKKAFGLLAGFGSERACFLPDLASRLLSGVADLRQRRRTRRLLRCAADIRRSGE